MIHTSSLGSSSGVSPESAGGCRGSLRWSDILSGGVPIDSELVPGRIGQVCGGMATVPKLQSILGIRML